MGTSIQDAKWRTSVLLYLASVVEKADEQVLPAVYKYIGVSLGATPTQLGTLTLCRALVQVIFLFHLLKIPLWLASRVDLLASRWAG
jgi:hypothetical protein